MGRDQHHPPLVAQLAQQGHDLLFGPHIDTGKGLIEQNHLPVLRQRPREKHPLALPTRQLADLPVPEVAHVHPCKCLIDGRPVGGFGAAHEAHVTVTPHHHHILDQHRKGPVDLLGLRDVGHEVLPQRLGHRHPENPDLSLRRGDKPHDRLEQRRLPCAVHPDQSRHRAARNLETCVPQCRLPVPIGHGHVARRDPCFGIGHFNPPVSPFATVVEVTASRSR